MDYSAGNERTGRIVLPDLVRAFALLGIALVNVAYFAFPGDVTYHDGGIHSAFDHSAYFAVNSLFLFKSYTLFSFMFGVGLAYQMRSVERRGKSFGPTYFRRLVGMMILGILHVSLAFLGDILIVYSILGAFLYLCRNSSQSTLLRIGAIMIVIQVLVALLFAASLYMAEIYSPAQWQDELVKMNTNRELARQIYTSGSFSEIVAQRWSDWTSMMLFAAPLQAPGAFGFFAFGLAAVRANILTDADASIWSKSRRICLPVGVMLSIAGTYLYMSSEHPMSGRAMLGYALLLVAAPLSSVGYIGLIAAWSRGPMTSIKTFIARGGTASLTAYLLQSLILSLVFCSYGLGMYGVPGAFSCIAIALVTGVFSIGFTSMWRKRFDRGPLESLLRSWTYYTLRSN